MANAILGKVAYIPAERIIVSLPGIQQTDLPYNSLRSFIFDWSKIRTKYNENNPVLIDDLNQKYYYDENSGRDMMVLESGKEIPFMESSSGIQSYVPLHISLKYLTEWIYNNQEDISYEKQDLIDSVVARFFLNEKEISGGDYTEQSFAIIKKQDHIQRIIKSLSKIDESDSSISNPKDEFESALSRAIDLRKRISKAHFSDIVIEEPELNLFPETQCSMIRVILEIVSRERDNFIITTHSPYILYALNNYMLGWLVKDTLAEENVEGFSSQKSFFVDPKKVSVWEIKDGTFWPLDNKVNGTIQDSDGLIRRNYFNKSMKSIMKDFNTFLGYYDKD